MLGVEAPKQEMLMTIYFYRFPFILLNSWWLSVLGIMTKDNWYHFYYKYGYCQKT